MKYIFTFYRMKNLLLTTAIALPLVTFATPAETTQSASLAVNFAQVQELNTVEDFQMHQKGRGGDSGIRAMDYRPFEYDNTSLINKIYKENIVEEVEKPGVIFGYNCFHWKNCLKDAYHATNRYNEAYKKFKPASAASFTKAATRGNMRGRKNQLDGERNGLYKIERWTK